MIEKEKTLEGETIHDSDSGLTYTLVEHIGSGSMGSVYKATAETKQGTLTYALKFPKSQAFYPHIHRSAETMKRIGSHPNIVKFEGKSIWQERGIPYLILEYIEGKDLGNYIADLITERKFDIDASMNLAFQLMDVMQGFHEKGIIHTDLNPKNIRITRNNNLKLLDFGLTKIIRDIEKESKQKEDSEQEELIKYEDYITRSAEEYKALDHENGETVIVNPGEYTAPESKKPPYIFSEQGDVFSIAAITHFCMIGRGIWPQIAEREIKDTEWSFLINIIKKGIDDIGYRYKSITDMKTDIMNHMKGMKLGNFYQELNSIREMISRTSYNYGSVQMLSELGIKDIGKSHKNLIISAEKHIRKNPIFELEIQEQVHNVESQIKERIKYDLEALLNIYANKDHKRVREVKTELSEVIKSLKKYPVNTITDYCLHHKITNREGIEIEGELVHIFTWLESLN